MNAEFILMSNSLSKAVIEPMLSPENREDTIRDFGALGLDIMTRWHRELEEALKGEPPMLNMSEPGALDALREELKHNA